MLFSDLSEGMTACGLSPAFLEAVTALQKGREGGYGNDNLIPRPQSIPGLGMRLWNQVLIISSIGRYSTNLEPQL